MTSDTPSATPVRRVLLSLAKLAAVLVLAVVGMRACHASQLDAAKERFRVAITPVLDRGDPVCIADLRHGDPPTDGNGAPGVMAAYEALVAKAGSEEQWPDGPWALDEQELAALDDATQEAIAAFLEEHRDYFAAIDAATEQARIIFPPSADPADLSSALDAWSLTRISALWQARARYAHDRADRLAALESMLRFARRWEPRTLIENLVAVAYAQGAATEIRRAIRAGTLDATTAASLDIETDFLSRFPDALRSERAFQLTIADHVVDLPGVDDERTGPVFPELEEEFRRQVLWSAAGPTVIEGAAELVEKTEAMLAAGTHDATVLAQAIADVTDAPAARRTKSWLPWVAARQTMARGSDGTVRHLFSALAGADCSLRLTRVVVAAAAHRESTGEWPASMEELRRSRGDSIPIDPWTGQDFELDRSADGYLRIASPGPQASFLPDAPGRPVDWVSDSD